METDARAVLTALIGQTVPTRRGNPNRVIGFCGENVIVGTTRSPAGKPIPIRYVEDALRRLSVDGHRALSSVGLRHPRPGRHRTTYQGAANPTSCLPGARRWGKRSRHQGRLAEASCVSCRSAFSPGGSES